MSSEHHELVEQAERFGVETTYWDTRGDRHDAATEPLLAVLRALGIDAGDPAGAIAAITGQLDERATSGRGLVVVWGARPLRAVVDLPSSAGTVEVVLELEDGTTRSASFDVDDLTHADPAGRVVVLEGPIPSGYHVLHVGELAPIDVLAAPDRVVELGEHERLWGLFAPVYALAGGTGLGAHIGVLTDLGEALDPTGAKIVATLPLLAAYLGEPFDPSPYAPVSRRFWNELFTDLAALPELQAVPAAGENLDGLRRLGHAANEPGKSFDYRHQYGYVRGVLTRVVAERDAWPDGVRAAFAEYLAARPDVTDYARFRALAERTRTGWHGWDAAARAGTIAERDVDPAVVVLHQFGQYAMDRGMTGLASSLGGRDQRLYLDLPVGAHGDGYDTWKDRDLFAWGAGAGAPPDDFFAAGQNWGFPPLRPWAPDNAQLWHFREMVRHHMRVAGILRLDHAMGLERLFWVPDGHEARDGIYVRYPRAALFAVLCIESARADCIVVGEDLGTVPDSIREEMDHRGLLGMYVAQFNQPAWGGAPLSTPSGRQLASIDTHDTPTFTGWLHGLDIDRRHVIGQLSDELADAARAERRGQVGNLVALLVTYGVVAPGTKIDAEADILAGLLRYLGDSDAPAVLVAVDDLVGERNPQNVPGTMIDRPNWVQRIRFGPRDLVADPAIGAMLDALQGCRLGAHVRSTGRV